MGLFIVAIVILEATRVARFGVERFLRREADLRLEAQVPFSAHRLTKRFGGFAAERGLCGPLARPDSRGHGPTAPGKSTLTNLLSGDLVPPQATSHWPAGCDRAAAQPFLRGGPGRSYQKTNILRRSLCSKCPAGAAQCTPLSASMVYSRAASFSLINQRTEQAIESGSSTARTHVLAPSAMASSAARNCHDLGH